MNDPEAQGDREAYFKYMRAGNADGCVSIEKKYDLYGYPPELVSVGLLAAVQGINPLFAIDEYMDEGES